MKYAFSPTGLALLKKHATAHALFAFDYDGTLAPVKKNPELALIPKPTRILLERLASAAPTAAVTGRALSDIRALVPTNFCAWAGNHGAEMIPSRKIRGADEKSARRHVKLWAKELPKLMGKVQGVWIEEKGFSLSVHYRQSKNREQARTRILQAITQLLPAPRVLPGKCVENLLLPELPHKGHALKSLLTLLRKNSAVYVGDDENDEDVFSLADPRICSVRIGKKAGSHATLYLKRQSEINRFLRLLLSLREAE